MTDKEKYYTLKDFKYSYNFYDKIYHVEILENSKWRVCKYDLDRFKEVINLKLKDKEDLRNKPFKPYLWFSIKWSVKMFLRFLDKHEKRINWFKKNLAFWIGITIPITATSIALISVKDAREDRQQVLRKTESIEKIKKELNIEKEVLNERIQMLTSRIDSLHLKK